MKPLTDILTTASGDHDIGRWAWVASFSAVVLDAVGLAFGLKLPTVTELAAALGVVAAAHAGALFVKQQTEPKETP